MFTQRKKKQEVPYVKGNKRFKQHIQTNLDNFLLNNKKINLEFEDDTNINNNKNQKHLQISHLFKKPKIKDLKKFYKLDLSSFIKEDINKQKDDFHMKEKKKFVQSEKKSIFKAKFIMNSNNLYMPYEPYSYQSQSVFLLSKALYSNKKAIMFESPTGTGKTQTILTTLLGYIKNKQVFKSKAHKILYFTRTVTQMNQVIDETKKSAYDVIATILSSRVSLCLNKDVNNQNNNNFQMINKCLDLQKTNSCPYKIDTLKPNKKFNIYNNVCDIEDLKEIGVGKNQCAYYFTKKMSEICDVVVLSYSYLVESIYRDSITNLVKNNFIVFDEAHNIAKVLEQASSWELKLQDFTRILIELYHLMNTAELKRREGDVDNGVVNLCEKATIIISKIQKNFLNFIKNKKEEFYCGSYIIQLFSLDKVTTKISFERLKDFIKQEKLKNILAKFLNIYQDMQSIFLKSKSDFNSFKLFINQKNEISFICLDAKIGFNNIMKLNPKQIILASGTLSPFDILEKQLGYSFDIKFSIEPDLESWYHSLAVMKISNFFNFHKNNSITFNYQSRKDKTLLTSFLKFLIFISQLIPQGILIFLPSYNILESYKNTIVANKDLRRELENEKQIFFESKSPNVQIQFQQYQKACQNKGACFFLVFRGKYSEGLDFKNELARLVMIIGIPFGNVGDIKLKAKKVYLNELKQSQNKQKEILNYHDWYINEAFVQINQAAGRIKRNQKDFGLVFLVDSRYSHVKYKKFISKHLNKLEKDIQQKNKFKSFIKKFFQYNLPQQATKKNNIKQKQQKIYTDLFQKCKNQIDKEQKIDSKEQINDKKIKNFQCKFCILESNNADEFQISNCDHLVCKKCFDKKETPKCRICKIYLKKNLIK